MSSSVRFAFAASLLLALAAPFAQAGDASVESRLDAQGIQYEIDEDGDYRIVLSFNEVGRSQIVYVSGRTESIGGFTVREVFAPAARISDGIDGDTALSLMAQSRDNKLGSWELGGDVLYFVLKLPEEIAARQLEVALSIAASAADDMELAFSGDRDSL